MLSLGYPVVALSQGDHVTGQHVPGQSMNTSPWLLHSAVSALHLPTFVPVTLRLSSPYLLSFDMFPPELQAAAHHPVFNACHPTAQLTMKTWTEAAPSASVGQAAQTVATM